MGTTVLLDAYLSVCSFEINENGVTVGLLHPESLYFTGQFSN